MSEPTIGLVKALGTRFGARCQTGGPQLRLYGYDATGTFAVPVAVVQVESAADVGAAVDLIRAHGGHVVEIGRASCRERVCHNV